MSSLNFVSGRDFVTTDGTHKRSKNKQGFAIPGVPGRPNINKETFKELPKYKDPENFSNLKYEMTNQHVYEKMRDDYIDGKQIKKKNYEKTLFSKDIHVYNAVMRNNMDMESEYKAKKFSNLIQIAKERVREERIKRQEPRPIIKNPIKEEKMAEKKQIPKQKKKVAIAESEFDKKPKKTVNFADPDIAELDEPNLAIPKNPMMKYAQNYVPDQYDDDSLEDYGDAQYAQNPHIGNGDESSSEDEDDYDKPAFLNNNNLALMKEIYKDFEKIKDQKKNEKSAGGGYYNPYMDDDDMTQTTNSKRSGMKKTGTGSGVGSQRSNNTKTINSKNTTNTQIEKPKMPSEHEIKTTKVQVSVLDQMKDKENPTEILRRKVEECQRNLKQIQANVKKISGAPGDSSTAGLDSELQSKVAKFRIQKGVVSNKKQKY